jgi:hypothetical protein
MQTLGTVLQLSGSLLTFLGLLWVLHVTAGRLAEWRGAVRDRWTRLGDSIDKWVKQTSHETGETIKVSAELTGSGQLTAKAEGFSGGITGSSRNSECVDELSLVNGSVIWSLYLRHSIVCEQIS